ncbi:MAG: N-acetylmuramoyl-L-alanine amidase [Spirochaetaceae bacterium]|jgi:N-acetylmuramoyl-L-alanine amidase|nr:N-acetylmuramoyl-L-alanine amidase [Spirochaetaceae bacterium]
MIRTYIIFFIYIFCSQIAPAQSASHILTLDEAIKTLDAIHEGAVEFRWDPIFQTGVFSVLEHYASFQTGVPGESGIALIDGKEILTSPSPYIEKGQLHFPEDFIAALKRGFEQAIHAESLFRIAAIIVDPGHGGKDAGAVGNHTINGKAVRIVEKDVVLKVSKDLYGRLNEGFSDKQVLITRETDTYPTLDERVNLANSVSLKENEAIIYISVHANATFNKTVRGYEVWYLKPDYERSVLDPDRYEGPKEVASIVDLMLQEEFLSESIRMAGAILKRFEEMLGNDLPSRGLKAEEWFVVRNARMPAILVELGFLTNEADAALLSDDAYLKKFAEALYNGIRDFIIEFERSGGYTVVE